MNGTRNAGVTRTCAGCRYWSEEHATWRSGQIVSAWCVHTSGPPPSVWLPPPGHSCELWASGHLGAIDTPGNAPLYAESDAALAHQSQSWTNPPLFTQQVKMLPTAAERHPHGDQNHHHP
jgi:hypothetical protein